MSRALNILVAMLLVGQGAFAQAPAPGGPRSGRPAAAGPAGARSGAISVPGKPNLTVKEMLVQSRDYRARVQDVLLRIQTLQTQARRQKDIIRLNCLGDKLVQAKVNLNIADQAIAVLEDATERKDEDAGVHEFTRITIVAQKAQVIGAEAEACVGADLSFVGATKVEVEVEASIPKDDLTTPAIERPPVERPPQASPTQ